ncbi:MAG: BREX system ATP-binding protein BrxD [Candidatus Velthaea sp.]
MNTPLSSTAADRVIEALRLGEVPDEGLDAIGTGIDEYLAAFERELPRIERGDGRIRFVRGDFGTGKTFFLKAFGARARAQGFATAYLRISYPELPLGRPIALYAATARDLQTRHRAIGAFRETIDSWIYRAHERVTDPSYGTPVDESDPKFDDAVAEQLSVMLGTLFDEAALYAQVVAAYSRALSENRTDIARGLLQWIAGDEHVDASIKRYAHLRGALGQIDALAMFGGLTTILTQSGSKGLVLLIDELERVLHRPANQRAEAYRSLQNFIGALTTNLRHVLVVVAGTSSFFEHPKGIREVEPLRQRIETTFDDVYPDLDAVQLKLPPFDRARLVEVGRKIVRIFVDHAQDSSIGTRVSERVVIQIADDVIGAFGGDIAIAPRQFFRRLVSTLSRAKAYPEYDPSTDRLERTTLVRDASLADAEREVLTGARVQVPLDL